MGYLAVIWCACRAYKQAKKMDPNGSGGGSAYNALTSHGIPYMACFVATGREAWRVSQRAMEEFELVERKVCQTK